MEEMASSSSLPHDIRNHIEVLNKYLEEAATRGYLVVLDAHEREHANKPTQLFLTVKIYEQK
jgi:hypothetical protein